MEDSDRSWRRAADLGAINKRFDVDGVVDPILVAVGVLAAAGLVISAYFVALRYHWLSPTSRVVPKFCRMDDGACTQVVHTRWGNVFGLPNALFGVLWYGQLIAWAFGVPFPRVYLIATAAFVAAFSVLLAWALLVRMRTRCVLCFTSHGINFVVLALLLV